jgi:hypothetical protein
MVWSFCSWNCSNSCIRERAFLQSDLHYNFAWLHHLEFAETMLLLSQAVAPLYMADPDIGHCWLSGSKILSMATTTQHSSKCRDLDGQQLGYVFLFLIISLPCYCCFSNNYTVGVDTISGRSFEWEVEETLLF